VSREEPRLAKIVDIRRWREEKARKAKPPSAPPPPPEPQPRGLALALGFACCLFGLGISYLPFWTLLQGMASRFSLAILFGIVLPAGLGIAVLGVDLVVRVIVGQAGQGWYLRRIRLRRRKPPQPGEDPPRVGSRPHEL
jgi:hypothetical protein